MDPTFLKWHDGTFRVLYCPGDGLFVFLAYLLLCLTFCFCSWCWEDVTHVSCASIMCLDILIPHSGQLFCRTSIPDTTRIQNTPSFGSISTILPPRISNSMIYHSSSCDNLSIIVPWRLQWRR